MSLVAIEDRVDRIEALFGQFMTEMAVLNKRADERNKAAEERMSRFETEIRESRREIAGWKREMDKKWGDLANNLGTIIEDILAPNLRRLAFEHFRFESILDFMLRRSRRRPDRPEIESEFDVLVVGETAVMLGEAKSAPSLEFADAFAAKANGFFDFFPEYRGRRLIPVFGSWAIADPIVNRLTAHGIYAMRMGEGTMGTGQRRGSRNSVRVEGWFARFRPLITDGWNGLPARFQRQLAAEIGGRARFGPGPNRQLASAENGLTSAPESRVA